MQLMVYMDIIDFLKPRYVLMENVVDILKFVGGFLGHYALGRLVAMNYQARMGMMAAGSYGLPQFRMRVFLWRALPTEKLPAFPLPTHEVESRSVIPIGFQEITVAYATNEKCQLAEALYLKDAIDDLPPIKNDESQDERCYRAAPRSEFQKYIRLKRSGYISYEMVNYSADYEITPSGMLYDHLPLKLNKDDYERACHIPPMELALSLEKLANEKLLNVHSVADRNNDPQLADFIESEFLEEQALTCANFELRGCIDQYDGQVYYGVVNTVSDEQSKLGTKYTVPQIAFYKAIIEAIVQDATADGFISSIDALNLNLESQLCRTAEEHPEIIFLKVNFDENKPMCKSLNVKVLPYFHFYRGAEGQLESFSCSLAKFQKIKEAIQTHNTARCSIGPPKGIGDLVLETSSAPKDRPADSV